MAPANCATCGFFLKLAGSMGTAFGVCANEVSPADGRVVSAKFGCGAHSETEVDTSSSIPVAEVVYDDAALDIEPHQPEREGANRTRHAPLRRAQPYRAPRPP